LSFLRKQPTTDSASIAEAAEKNVVRIISSSQSSPVSVSAPPPVLISPLIHNITELRNHAGRGSRHYVTFFYDKEKEALTIKFTEKKNDTEQVEGILVEKLQFIF
jgi:hypothetical protein